jgi:hypothetical protein
MQNLRDKLLKAGLVSADQAAEASAPAPAPAARPAARPPAAAAAKAAGPLIAIRREPLPSVLPKLPPLPGSREAQRLESRKQLEHDRSLREQVSAAEVPVLPGERAFYFVTRKNRLRRMELSVQQAEALESGALAVVERPEPGQIEHALVPREAAESLLRDFPKAVRFFNRQGEPVGFLSDEELLSRQKTEAAEASHPEAPAAPAESPGDSPPAG